MIVECIKCGLKKEIKERTFKLYCKRNQTDQYTCHKCKCKMNNPKLGQKLKKNQDINIKCEKCNKEFNIKKKNYQANKKRNNGQYICKNCSLKKAHQDGKFQKIYDEEFKSKLKSNSEKFWEENRDTWKDNLITEEFLQKMSESGKKAWTTEFRKKMADRFKDPEYIKKHKEWSKLGHKALLEKYDNYYELSKKWGGIAWNEESKARMESNLNDPEYIKNLRKWGKKAWTPEFKEKMAIVRQNQPRISNIQNILYSILDDIGIEYVKEPDNRLIIGPYCFDCLIPRNDNRDLLIECNGDYWHSLPKTIKNDKSKSTYINKYFNNEYELKYIWEHEFDCKDKIVENILYWLGKKLDIVDFSFDDIIIKDCPAADYRLLLSKYHYLHNAGRGGSAFGAYFNDELIAVCVFSKLLRQNLPHDYDSTVELSRLCIHPKYQKKNFASWFVSRCLKLLSDNISEVISYSDSTYNHFGTVYKACNFSFVGNVKPDYWYVDDEGTVMHKRTLYGKSKKFGISEFDYADRFGYKKVFGFEKLKFIYNR